MLNPPVLLPIGDTISKGWKSVHGAKGPIWGAVGLMVLVILGFFLFGYLFNLLWPAAHLDQVFVGISQIIVTLMSFGLLYIGIQHTYSRPISYTMVYQPFTWSFVGRLIGLFLLYIVILIPVFAIFIAAPLLLAHYSHVTPEAGKLIVSGCYLVAGFIWIYLALRISLAMFYLLDTDKGPWNAMKSSFQATRSNFWRLFWVYVLTFLIFGVTAITIVALIWTIPMVYMIYGWIYHTLKVNAE